MGYITIPEELFEIDLSLKETVCLAIIYGFSQSDQGKFHGTKNYIARMLRCSKRTADEVVDALVEKGLIIRGEIEDGGIKKVSYSINEGGCIFCTGAYSARVQFSHNRGANSAPINKISNKIFNTSDNTSIARTRADLVLPYNSELFKTTWETLIRQPKWKIKTVECLAGNLKKLAELSEADAISVMEYSINGNYQGIFPEKASGKAGRPMTKGEAQWMQAQQVLNENPYQ